jgi:predicted component of type VI protein secretion system
MATQPVEDLLGRDPIAMTQREMLLRLDARLDKFEPRIRAIEDEQLVARTERKTLIGIVGTLRSTILAAAALGPVIAGVLAYAASSAR